MAFGLISRFGVLLARLIGRERRDWAPMPVTQNCDSSSAIPIVGEALLSAYTVVAPLAGSIGWLVYNSVTNRIVATDLSQARATTLRDILNLAGDQPSNPQARAVHRSAPQPPRPCP